MSLTELIRRLCTQSLYSFAKQNQRKLEWIVKRSDIAEDEKVSKPTLRALLAYLDKFKACPASPRALADFVRTNPDISKAFEREAPVIWDELEALESWEPDSESLKKMDIFVLLEDVYSQLRRNWHVALGQAYSSIATGAQALKNKDGTEEKGPSAAMRWLRTKWTFDFSDETPPVAGIMHENVPSIAAGLIEQIQDEDTGSRFPLGYLHIDDCVIVGKQDLRFLGIMGMSGDGKTTFLNSIVYNWLKLGAHILYDSTEHTPLELWQAMAFAHQSHGDYKFELPSRDDWKHRRGVTKEDIDNMATVLQDIQDRRNLPGLLDVQAFFDFDTIQDHLITNFSKNRYDILIIDYLTRLDIPGDAKFRDNVIKSLIHRCQKLTREFDEGRGLIVVTPIQVNREAHKASLKMEPGQPRYNINAVGTYSEFQHDMDLILSVFSDDEMKRAYKIEIAGVKLRQGSFPETTNLFINKNSGLVGYRTLPESAPSASRAWEKAAEDMIEHLT